MTQIACGYSLVEVCDFERIGYTSVLDWLKDDEGFRVDYTRAREQQADALADKMLALAKQATPENWQVKKLEIDTLKWHASKLKPKVYGDRPADVSVTTVVHNHVSVEQQKKWQERHKAAMGR